MNEGEKAETHKTTLENVRVWKEERMTLGTCKCKERKSVPAIAVRAPMTTPPPTSKHISRELEKSLTATAVTPHHMHVMPIRAHEIVDEIFTRLTTRAERQVHRARAIILGDIDHTKLRGLRCNR